MREVEPVRPLTVLAYAAPTAAFAMLAAPTASIIPALYVQAGALSMTAAGLALLVARGAAVAAAPVMGLWLDQPGGASRKRWAVPGAALIAVVAWSQWLSISADHTLPWFLGWSVCLFLAQGLFEIAHRAAFPEIASREADRFLLAGWRTGMGVAGTMLALGILEWFREADVFTTTALPRLAQLSSALLALSAAAYCFLRFRTTEEAARAHRHNAGSIRARVEELLALPRVRLALAITLLAGVGNGMTSALFFFYVSQVLDLGWAFARLMLVTSAAGILCALLCPFVLRRFSAGPLVAVSSGALAAVLAALAGFPYVATGGVLAVAALFSALSMAATLAEIATTALIGAMVDEARNVSPGDHGGTLFGAQRLVSQTGLALGAAAALGLAGLAGFDPTRANGPLAVSAFLAAFGMLPALLHVGAAGMALRLEPRGSRG